ncbi:MAG: hypothetical protein HOP17_12285 [Acidobacteria bacterium]|nr:hypothetical protein [Acidobacteriota bacterium]
MRSKASTTSPVTSKSYKDVGPSTKTAKPSSYKTSEFEKKLELANERVRNAIDLAFEKAVAHRENPAVYPLPAGAKSVERAFHDLLSAMPNNQRKKVIDRVNATLKASPGVRSAKYKDIVNVDFHAAVPIGEQVKAMPVPATMKFDESEAEGLLAKLRSKAGPSTGKSGAKAGKAKIAPRQAVVATNISFVVDTMTCLNPDDLIKDEISLAGFSIDTNGTESRLAPLFVGKFKKNDTLSLGGNSKLFTLPIDPVIFPQTFTAGLFIIESDWTSNQELLNKLFDLFVVISATISILFLPIFVLVGTFAPALVPAVCIALGAIVVVSMIGKITVTLIGDDISAAVTDTLVIENKVEIGDAFARALTIGQGRDPENSFDGQYTLSARWVGEA